MHTDHQSLETIFRKALNKAPARLQKIMLKLQRYTFDVTYKRYSSVCVADTLSKAASSTPMEAKVTGFEVFRLRLELDDRQPNTRLKPATEARLLKETQNGHVIPKLGNVITRGWPTDKPHRDRSLQPFWSYRDELSTQNGIIYKGLQALIPPSMHTELLHSSHSNHLGAQSNIRMTKEVLFWPGMKSAIHDMCQTCTACAK